MLNWDFLQILLAIHRTRTLAGAARLLKLDATTVGRRLNAIEDELGTKLVERTPEGWLLTEAGSHAVAVAEKTGELVNGFLRDATGSDTRVEGVVRITSGDGILGCVLVPALPVLRERYPSLRVELLAATRTFDLVRREADLALRLFRPRETSLVTKRLSALTYGLYASPEYLRRRGTPQRVTELRSHEFVTFDASLDRTPEMEWLREQVSDQQFTVRCSSIPLVLSAAKAGLGICAVADRFVTPADGLVRVLPRTSPPTRDVWAVFHPDLRKSARISAVLEWLEEALAR